jgi:hypothetical protein
MKAKLSHFLGTVTVSTNVDTHPDKPVVAEYKVDSTFPDAIPVLKTIFIRELDRAIGLYGHIGVFYNAENDTFDSTNMDLYVALQGLDGFSVDELTEIKASKMPEGVLT